MRDALADHDAIFRDVTERNHGYVFKTVGDAFCCAFTSPRQALDAAIEAQRTLHTHAWPSDVGEIYVRMGIHTGRCVERDGDYFGPTVNRVARLMSIAYGRQILVSSAAAAPLRETLDGEIELRDLGSHRLKDLSQPETTFQVLAEGLRPAFPALASLDSHPNNLPSQISSFVGRERELLELREALREHRLVTIVGAGGIGKTRIALQLAAEEVPAFKDGAWLVELAAIEQPTLVPQAVAAALNLHEVPTESIERTILVNLADRKLLLLIDNSEHVLAATADLVKKLLSGCPGLRVLLTSRERLHVTGEYAFSLRSLDAQPSAKLFLERAADSASSTDAAEAATVARICERLEGIPLAIELAAARAGSMSLFELETALGDRLATLVSRDTTQSDRHRTLKGTIDWSFRLLDDREQRLLGELSVFPDDFDSRACQGVAAGPDVMGALECLLAKSFVARRVHGQVSRYVLADVMREYATLTLDEERRRDLEARHFAYFLAVSRGGPPDVPADVAKAWLERVALERSNLRAALAWGIDHDKPETVELVTNVARFWQIRGHIGEGRFWLSKCISAFDKSVPGLGKIFLRAAVFATIQDEYEEATRLNETALRLSAESRDEYTEAEAIHAIAVTELRQGNLDAARTRYMEVWPKFARLGHHRGVVASLGNLSMIAREKGDLDEAERVFHESVSACEHIQDDELWSSVFSVGADIALLRGDLDDAEARARAALSRASGESGIAIAREYDTLAAIRVRQGLHHEARIFVAECLRLALELEEHAQLIHALEGAADVLLLEDEKHAAEAARCFLAAASLRGRYGFRQQAGRATKDLEASLRVSLGAEFDRIELALTAESWSDAARDFLAKSPERRGAL
jgi:predicted ATPase